MELIIERRPDESDKDYETRKALAEIAREDLEQLNPDYLMYCYDVADPEGTRRSIRFGDLPIDEQESLRKALESEARGEIFKYDLEANRPKALQ